MGDFIHHANKPYHYDALHGNKHGNGQEHGSYELEIELGLILNFKKCFLENKLL